MVFKQRKITPTGCLSSLFNKISYLFHKEYAKKFRHLFWKLYYNSSVIWFSVVIFSNTEPCDQPYQMFICPFGLLLYYLSYIQTDRERYLLSFVMCLFFAEGSKGI